MLQKKRPNPEEDLDVMSKVELNKTVINIQWNQDRALVRCADGSDYSAEFVIVTPSLGVLKAHHERLFTPRLPDWKVKAIDNIAYGSLEKIFFEFSHQWWPTDPDWVQYSILWSEEDIALVRGTDREWLV